MAITYMGKLRRNNGPQRGQTPNMIAGNGGMLGSGVFGMFGNTVQCQGKDDNLYCNLVKLFNLLLMALVLFFIVYFIYNLSRNFKGIKQKSG